MPQIDSSNARAVQLSFKKSTEGLTPEERDEYDAIQKKNKMTNDVIMNKSYSSQKSPNDKSNGS